MQAFKERELEHVRWRSVKGHANDENLLAQLADTCTIVYKNTEAWDLHVLLPGSASDRFDIALLGTFITEAHNRSLKVTDLKRKDHHNSRAEYGKLLQEFPASTVKKLRPDQLATLQGRAHALTQLVSKHSGEVVELDPRNQD